METINIEAIALETCPAEMREGGRGDALESLRRAAEEGSPGKFLSAVFVYNKNSVIKGMVDAGIETVSVSYDGYGDSGGVEDVSIDPPGSREVKIPYLYPVFGAPEVRLSVIEIDEALNHIAEDAISEAGLDGYENGEGGRGVVVIEAAPPRITVVHRTPVVTYEEETHVF